MHYAQGLCGPIFHFHFSYKSKDRIFDLFVGYFAKYPGNRMKKKISFGKFKLTAFYRLSEKLKLCRTARSK
ncbi:hypothetical protein LEP1GSC058_1953 [Leptospira fainei serovar Hurstbridge str. BUT 6]|uniref:Uncharacterized protein n=1 Tax=Leptospira fainei serovar Hurstbridge str. BUT 6 TaxID=1193011 RepID=S3V4N3_9LEPT|nr:hypothetical protein LEP1GSC058_1953 [Leptospira fainei serovar Hurstbridge str. BUT 6]